MKYLGEDNNVWPLVEGSLRYQLCSSSNVYIHTYQERIRTGS